MALASGQDSQLGFINEVTYGTYAAPTRFAEFTSESLKLEIERIDSKGIRAGRRVLHRWAAGIQRVTGDIELEFAAQGTGLLLKHMFGSVVTAGAGPYTHTATPGDLADKSFTIQFNRPDITGTDRVFSYLGCVIADWELSCNVNEYLMGKLGIYGAHEDTAQALASVSYPAGLSPFVFTHGSVSVAGSSYDVKSFNLKADNTVKKDRHFIRGTTPARPKQALEAGLRDFTGALTSDFESLTAYNRFVNATEAALVLTFNAGATAILEITMNVRYDGETPTVNDRDLLEQSLPFKVISGTSDAAAITAVLTNSDSAP